MHAERQVQQQPLATRADSWCRYMCLPFEVLFCVGPGISYIRVVLLQLFLMTRVQCRLFPCRFQRGVGYCRCHACGAVMFVVEPAAKLTYVCACVCVFLAQAGCY